jgi:hypothetical protein
VHRVIGPVATLNIANALLQGHGLTGRPRGHVGNGERVHDWTVLNRKGGQHLDQAALLGLKARPRVMSDQTSQPLLAVGAKEPGAVHGMEAEPIQGGSVAHVMRGRGRAGSACGLKATTTGSSGGATGWPVRWWAAVTARWRTAGGLRVGMPWPWRVKALRSDGQVLPSWLAAALILPR